METGLSLALLEIPKTDFGVSRRIYFTGQAIVVQKYQLLSLQSNRTVILSLSSKTIILIIYPAVRRWNQLTLCILKIPKWVEASIFSWLCSKPLIRLVTMVAIFSSFFSKNICCGYSLKVSHWDTSRGYPQHMSQGSCRECLSKIQGFFKDFSRIIYSFQGL